MPEDKASRSNQTQTFTHSTEPSTTMPAFVPHARPRRLTGLALSLVICSLFTVILTEAVVRFFPSIAPLPSEQNELDWRAAHRSSGELIKNNRETFDVYSPELGWQLQSNLRTHTVNSNSQGIRGIREFSFARKAGTHRVIAMGDSFVFGENLTDSETFPAHLEKHLQPNGSWEVLNIAVHGYGLDQQWLRLERLGFKFQADLVLMGIFDDDILRTTLSFRDYAKPYFELIEGQLVLRNSPVPPPEQILSSPMQYRSCVIRLGCLTQTAVEKLARALPGLSLEHTRAGTLSLAILDTVQRAVRARGQRLMLVSIPRRKFDQRATKEELLLTDWAERNRTPLVNLRQRYLELPSTEREKLYAGHWTPYGASVTASLVAKEIAAIAAVTP